MRHLHLLAAATLLLTGCPMRDQDPSNTAGATGTPGGGGLGPDGGAGQGGSGGIPPTPITVTITSPTTIVYTNATVSISITTSQPTTNSITFVAAGPDGSQTVGTIAATESAFTWNTTGVGEGTYSVTAQLTVGGTTTMSNAITVVVDRTPPKVVVGSLVPAPGATNVILKAPIEASFSEAVLASTVSSAAIPIQTSSGATLPTTAALSPDGKSVSVQVTSTEGDFTLGQQVLGSFTNGITDLAGNALEPLSTTWGWKAPPWIQYAPITSGEPNLLLAVGNNYLPVVAYNLCGGQSGGACMANVHVAVSDGEAWNDLGQVVAGIGANLCALFLDGKNNPTVAWGNDPSNGTAQVVFSTWNGTAWVTTTYPAIDLMAGQLANAIAVALDSSGNPVVAYRGDVPFGSTNIYVAAWSGTAWNTSYGGVGDATNSTFDLVLDGSDHPVVSVVDTDSSSGVYVWNGGAWSSTYGASSANAAATVDASGNPVMLSSATSSWVPNHLTGGTWLPLVSAAVPISTNAGYPSMTSDDDHQPVVAWVSPSTSTPGIGIARWTGASWDNRPPFATGGAAPNTARPALTVDGRNEIWIGWGEGSTVNVWMSNY